MPIEEFGGHSDHWADYRDLEELAFGIGEDSAREGRLRLDCYRRLLQGQVRFASELVEAMATPGELVTALNGMWPSWRFDLETTKLPRTRGSWLGGSARVRLGIMRRCADRGRIADLVTMGVRLRAPRGDVSGVGVRVVDNALEIRLVDTRSLITTRAGILRLDLEANLPETLVEALPGRMLSEVIEHLALIGGSHRIVRALSGRGFLSVFATAGTVPYAMPWPDLLQPQG